MISQLPLIQYLILAQVLTLSGRHFHTKAIIKKHKKYKVRERNKNK